jgi:hypothetical protein
LDKVRQLAAAIRESIEWGEMGFPAMG